MNISYNWLKNYLKTDLSAEKIAEILTDIGLEVEEFEKIETIRGGLAGVVVGEVLTCVDHPDSDHLHVTTVDVGAGEPLNIVCGAPNVRVGMKTAFAKIGAKIGEEVEVNVTFPEEYHAEELKGKPALFKVKVNEIKVRELPEIDDDFASEVSEFDTLAEYKADVKAKLEEKAKV